MIWFKKKYPTHEEQLKYEFRVNMVASFLAGAIGSALTNSCDVLTINKQTSPELNLWTMIKTEKMNLFTKGLFARVYYNSLHSVMFFNLILLIGKIYNVELSEE
jgi:hypothetical protein